MYSLHRVHRQHASRDEAAVAALFWESGTWAAFWDAWWPAHGQAVHELLYGRGPHLRPGAAGRTPEEIRRARTRVPAGLGLQDVLDALPGAYVAPEFRGFAHDDKGFRDWHLASHSVGYHALRERLAAQVGAGVDWAYIVLAHGQGRHAHALVRYRFAHPAAFVRRTLGLAEGDKLTPIHGDFGDAKRYLDNQATRRAEELGVRPAGKQARVWIDGNRVELGTKTEKLQAIAAGTPTYVLPPEQRTGGQVEKAALAAWAAQAAAPGGEHHTHRKHTARGARDAAARKAADYTGRVCEVDFAGRLPGAIFARASPPDWFGEEVVVLLNIPSRLRAVQLRAAWLRAVPWVYYTVSAD